MTSTCSAAASGMSAARASAWPSKTESAATPGSSQRLRDEPGQGLRGAGDQGIAERAVQRIGDERGDEGG